MRLFAEPHVATAKDCGLPWKGARGGAKFRCQLCGHKFKPGDVWRAVYTNSGETLPDGRSLSGGNPLVCEACYTTDEDVKKRWTDANEELHRRFWWALPDNELRRYSAND